MLPVVELEDLVVATSGVRICVIWQLFELYLDGLSDIESLDRLITFASQQESIITSTLELNSNHHNYSSCSVMILIFPELRVRGNTHSVSSIHGRVEVIVFFSRESSIIKSHIKIRITSGWRTNRNLVFKCSVCINCDVIDKEPVVIK